jgi:hypothetical protein
VNRAATGHAGRVHHAVEPTGPGYDRGHGGTHCIRIENVDLLVGKAFSSKFFRCFGCQVDADHDGALSEKTLGRGPSDAGRRAGDQHTPTFEPLHHSSPRLRPNITLGKPYLLPLGM